MKIIPIAKFRARDNPDGDMTVIKAEKTRHGYYYLDQKGRRSIKYHTLAQLKADIQEIYGNWHDFRFIVGDKS